MRVKIHDTTYIFLFLSFLSGYFEYLFLLLITILIHEAGHLFFSILIDFKYDKITIYPFGGITTYNEDLNVNSNKELFVLLGGITFELIFYFMIKSFYFNGFITNHVFYLLMNINYLLISFNFMPILPLDGGKLLNILLNKIMPYKISNIISLMISVLFTIIFIITKKTLFAFILTIFLFKCIIIEIKNLKYKQNKFILERYLNNYNFDKIKRVKNTNNFKRDYYHIINNCLEKKYLSKLFDRTK